MFPRKTDVKAGLNGEAPYWSSLLAVLDEADIPYVDIDFSTLFDV